MQLLHFYPRSPRGERLGLDSPPRAFLGNFYPRSPRGERRLENGYHGRPQSISIHAPREGSDLPSIVIEDELPKFLSTLPARGATHRAAEYAVRYPISIHAPREGSDRHGGKLPVRAAGISIHAPREGSDGR